MLLHVFIVLCSLPDKKKTKETVKTEVTEDMLKQMVQVVLTETDSVSLLDIPTTSVSTGAEDAQAIMSVKMILIFSTI